MALADRLNAIDPRRRWVPGTLEKWGKGTIEVAHATVPIVWRRGPFRLLNNDMRSMLVGPGRETVINTTPVPGSGEVGEFRVYSPFGRTCGRDLERVLALSRVPNHPRRDGGRVLVDLDAAEVPADGPAPWAG